MTGIDITKSEINWEKETEECRKGLLREVKKFLEAPHRESRFAVDRYMSSYDKKWTEMIAEQRREKPKKRKKK